MRGRAFVEILRAAWAACRLEEHLISREISEGYFFQVSESAISIIRAVWALAVYDLCGNRFVADAFDVPLYLATNQAAIWIHETAYVFSADPQPIAIPSRPEIIHPVMIAIGGPSGVGKTTAIKRMKRLLPSRMLTYPAFTNRPPRPEEQDGVDYYFRDEATLAAARNDPHYMSFVEARSFWYWISPSAMLEGVWANAERIHVFVISQRRDFEARLALFPRLRWIWLHAEEDDIASRLMDRGDESVEASLAYNRRINAQAIEDLISLRIENRVTNLDATVGRIIAFCRALQEERRKQWRPS